MKRLTVLMAASALSLTATAALAQGMERQGGPGMRAMEHLCATDQQWTTDRMAERLSDRLNLTEQQKPALQALRDAVAKARGDAKTALCGSKPDMSTLPARMAFMQKRLQARLDGIKAVQPKLEAFYAALNAEQQAEFNHLWHRGMRGRGGDGDRRWGGQGDGQDGGYGRRRFGDDD